MGPLRDGAWEFGGIVLFFVGFNQDRQDAEGQVRDGAAFASWAPLALGLLCPGSQDFILQKDPLRVGQAACANGLVRAQILMHQSNPLIVLIQVDQNLAVGAERLSDPLRFLQMIVFNNF